MFNKTWWWYEKPSLSFLDSESFYREGSECSCHGNQREGEKSIPGRNKSEALPRCSLRHLLGRARPRQDVLTSALRQA